MLERRREARKAPPSETIQRPPRSADWGLWWQPRVLRPGPLGLRRNNKLKTRFAGSQPVRVAGSRPQGPVGHVSRGLGAWAPRAQGPGAFSPQKPTSRFFAKEPGEGVGVGAETAASEVGTCPPDTHERSHFGAVREKGRGFSPSPPSATIQHAPQGRRI